MTIKDLCDELGIDVRNFNGMESYKIYIPEITAETERSVEAIPDYGCEETFIDSKNKIIYLTERI